MNENVDADAVRVTVIEGSDETKVQAKEALTKRASQLGRCVQVVGDLTGRDKTESLKERVGNRDCDVVVASGDWFDSIDDPAPQARESYAKPCIINEATGTIFFEIT